MGFPSIINDPRAARHDSTAKQHTSQLPHLSNPASQPRPPPHRPDEPRHAITLLVGRPPAPLLDRLLPRHHLQHPGSPPPPRPTHRHLHPPTTTTTPHNPHPDLRILPRHPPLTNVLPPPQRLRPPLHWLQLAPALLRRSRTSHPPHHPIQQPPHLPRHLPARLNLRPAGPGLPPARPPRRPRQVLRPVEHRHAS